MMSVGLIVIPVLAGTLIGLLAVCFTIGASNRRWLRQHEGRLHTFKELSDRGSASSRGGVPFVS